MTITQKGSRSILDLVEKWNFTRNGYTIPNETIDLEQYISEY
jgi:hypothetical protein